MKNFQELLMKMPPLQNRAAILLFFLFLWAALVAAHLFYYTIIASDKYIRRGNALAHREGTIPPKHGFIIDRNGIRLTWQETHIDLIVRHLEKSSYRNRMARDINRFFINFSFPEEFDNNLYLLKDLTPSDQMQLYPLVKKYPEIIFKKRVKKKYYSEKLTPLLIKLEKKYSSQLKGKEGLYQVMADKHGKWIPETWKEKIPALDGKNIKLKKSVNELQEEADMKIPVYRNLLQNN